MRIKPASDLRTFGAIGQSLDKIVASTFADTVSDALRITL
jgi:hypothetical protein